MNRPLGLVAAAALGASLSLLPGCKQGVGDRCQTNSDCDDSQNLICVIQSGGSQQSGGTCQPPGAGLDGSINVDLSSSVPDLATGMTD
jgi:hypothetical protein